MTLYKSSALVLFAASIAAAQQPPPSVAPVSPTQPVTDPAFPPPKKPESRGPQVVAILRTSMTSKSAREGAPLKLALRKEIALPGGGTLPKGTILTGKVTGASPHQKGKPNGALMLLVDTALVQDGAPIPLHVEIESLAPSVESETARVTLPSSNGGRLGGTGNAGGSDQLIAERSDTTGLRSNIKDSGVAGIYLRTLPGSSGVVFALNEDVFLDSGTQFTLRIGQGK